MRLATWNVNSIRTRVARTVEFAVREDIDVLAMQEIKCKPEQFPYGPFEEAGYQVEVHGLNQWNGVAIASRLPMSDVRTGFDGMPGFAKGHEGPDAPLEARALGVMVDGVRVWSLYVPNGRALDDPHMPYKLQWLETLKDQAAGWIKENPDLPLALMGDWNIAPEDDDVWDIELFRRENHTHVSEPERRAFRAFLEAGFTDVARPYTPGPGVYTYWDYTQLRFPKKEGMRIDFVLGSPAFAARVTGASIDREERKGKGASDHAPVMVELD